MGWDGVVGEVMHAKGRTLRWEAFSPVFHRYFVCKFWQGRGFSLAEHQRSSCVATSGLPCVAQW